MNIPSFVGPLGSIILFLLTVFGCWFYYCYWKPKRRRKRNAECSEETSAVAGSPSLKSRSKRTYKSDEDCYYGFNSEFSSYSAGYCFHGGFPMVSSASEQRWQPVKMKYQKPCAKFSEIEQCSETSDDTCCELRVHVMNERRAIPCKLISRQCSTDSRGSRQVCHLQAIQECEEEKGESEVRSDVNIRDLETQEPPIVSTHS